MTAHAHPTDRNARRAAETRAEARAAQPHQPRPKQPRPYRRTLAARTLAEALALAEDEAEAREAAQ